MLKTVMLMVLVTVTLCATVSEAYGQTVTIKEALPDGEYIVVIDGQEQRTITADHARRIIDNNESLDRCSRARIALDKQIGHYEAALVLLKKDRELADLEARLQQSNARRFETMYLAEQKLRFSAEALNASRSKQHWLVKLFENPYVDVGFRAVVPTVNLVRTLRQ